MVVSNKNIPFQGSIFRGYVSFREGIYLHPENKIGKLEKQGRKVRFKKKTLKTPDRKTRIGKILLMVQKSQTTTVWMYKTTLINNGAWKPCHLVSLPDFNQPSTVCFIQQKKRRSNIPQIHFVVHPKLRKPLHHPSRPATSTGYPIDLSHAIETQPG